MESAPPRVLVVDDNAALREVLDVRLRAIGCQPVLAASGEQALACLADDNGLPFDLVLLDQQMEGLAGTDVLEEQRRQDPDLPVVMLTAHGSTALAAAFMRMRADGVPGGTDIIEKPIPREPLFGTLVHNAVEEGRLRRRLRAAEAEAARLRTERAAEEALFLESLPYAALLLDAEGRVRMTNRAYQGPGFRGVARIGDAYPELCRRHIPGDAAAEGVSAVLAGHRTSFTHRYPRPDGTGGRHWWRMHVCRPANGQPGAMVSHFDIAVEVEAQERLRAAQHRLQTLAAHLPAWALMVRADGGDLRISFGSGAGLEQAGFPLGQIEGRGVSEVVQDPADRAWITFACREALAGRIHEHERVYDGQTYLVRTLPIRSTDGRIIEALSFGMDISSLKEAQAEAQRSARFAERVIASSFGLYVYDLERQGLVFQNEQFTRLTGWQPDWLAGLSPAGFFDLFHRQDRSGLLAHLEVLRRADDGIVVEHEMRIRSGGGDWRWLAMRNAVFERGPSGKVTQVIGTCVDITARKQAEAARRDLAAKQARLLEELSEGVLLVDGDGRIVSGNRAAHALFGYETGGLVGCSVDTLVPMATPWSEGSGIFTYLSDPKPARLGQEGIVAAVRRDGSRIPVTITFSGFADENATMVMALVSDASAEEARLRAETRATVAEESSKVAEAMMLNVMHQLGNYLQDLFVFLRLARNRWRKAKGDIEEAVDRAAGIVQAMTVSFDRMQALVRAEAVGHSLELVPVEADAMLAQAEREVAQSAADREIVISRQGEAAGATFMAEPGLMVEVLRNLLSNAVKFSKKGGRIKLSSRRVDGNVELRIADTGIGVPADERERIFHPLYRGAEVRDGRIPGTGVGLAIVARIVRRLGGRVWEEDNLAAATPENPRGGAVFILCFPALAGVGDEA